ncbi:MAG: Severe Depolymerization of Actin [Chrysothrix sp. TS-e1954]|nr:MAG: Severe Depolymerization of Actin [Chrysothrix sp. TS-e1954]
MTAGNDKLMNDQTGNGTQHGPDTDCLAVGGLGDQNRITNDAHQQQVQELLVAMKRRISATTPILLELGPPRGVSGGGISANPPAVSNDAGGVNVGSVGSAIIAAAGAASKGVGAVMSEAYVKQHESASEAKQNRLGDACISMSLLRSYRGDFEKQFEQYEAYRNLFIQAPTSAPDHTILSLQDLVDFISHVASCYTDVGGRFSHDLIELLQKHHEELRADLREKIVTSLVLLRKKDIVDSSTLLHVLFPILTTTTSKSLRSLLHQKIISDIRNSNTQTTNHKLNRTLQTVLYNLLTADRASPKGIWAVRITRELWRRQVWTDSKAVEIMKEAALAENVKVASAGVSFFLGGDKEREEAAEDSSDEEAIDMGRVRHVAGINKKTKKKERDLKNAAATVKRKERKKAKPHPLNFSALLLLHDPQGFAETLFTRHLQNVRSKLNLEQKLLVLQLVSRLVGLHRLTIISLYSYFLKYLTPRQASVTSFLASLAQSTHDLVPPDAIEPLLSKIANEFVSEAAAGQVAAAGLNAIREMCMRQPLAMNETLLQDLVMYRKSKDKSVMMAAKGLMSLYRDVGPEMLRKRDRGRDAALNMRSGTLNHKRFGDVEPGQIEGLELLEQWKDEERRKRRIEKGLPPSASNSEDEDEDADAEDWKNWDVRDDESESSGGWLDVSDDGEEIDFPDSDDEKPPASKKLKVSDDGTPASASDAATPTPSQRAASLEARTFISKLATTRILTPADHAKLASLRQTHSITSLLGPNTSHKTHHATLQKAAAIARHVDDPLTAADLEGASSLGLKKSKSETIAAAKAENEKQEHRGGAARKKEEKRAQGKSTTNKEKARQKNFLMTLGKARGKQKRSLSEIGKTLRGHVERQKRGGRRGNRG